MKRQNVRTLSLIVCTFTYLLIGAAIFDAFESETEKRQLEALKDLDQVLLLRYNVSTQDYRILETVILKSVPQKAGNSQWKFAGAFYYATTVLTTIGYGHSCAQTVGGKLFTMCYAAIGLVMFQSIGERLNQFSSFTIRNVKKLCGCVNREATETNLICVVTTLSTMTIAGGATVFSSYEGWTYFDSVYYCFITLTTIGFGDMVALQKDRALDSKPEYVAFTLVFILFGLAIVAASLNLFVMRLITMNTEDERRDEQEAQMAAAGAVRLEGDVITANGSIISGHLPRERDRRTSVGSLTSVCSCRCPKCPFGFMMGGSRRRENDRNRSRGRLNLTKSPKITHLQPFERKSHSVAVYHSHRHQQQNPPAEPSQFEHFQSHHTQHFGGGGFPTSNSFEISTPSTTSPVLEVYDSPFKNSSSKRMSF